MTEEVSGVHHVGFTVSNLERSMAFWAKFGFELESHFHLGGAEDAEGTGVESADYELALLTRSGDPFILELIEYREAEPRRAPRNNEVGAAHLALQISDVNLLYEQLRADGVEFVSAPHRQESTGVIWVYARDPDGITVELLQLLDVAGAEPAAA